jgi:hypothetical protein
MRSSFVTSDIFAALRRSTLRSKVSNNAPSTTLGPTLTSVPPTLVTKRELRKRARAPKPATRMRQRSTFFVCPKSQPKARTRNSDAGRYVDGDVEPGCKRPPERVPGIAAIPGKDLRQPDQPSEYPDDDSLQTDGHSQPIRLDRERTWRDP